MPLDLLLGAQPADDSSRSGLRIDHRILKVDALLLPGFKPDSEKAQAEIRLLFARFSHAKPCSGCWMRQGSVQPMPDLFIRRPTNIVYGVPPFLIGWPGEKLKELTSFISQVTTMPGSRSPCLFLLISAERRWQIKVHVPSGSEEASTIL